MNTTKKTNGKKDKKKRPPSAVGANKGANKPSDRAKSGRGGRGGRGNQSAPNYSNIDKSKLIMGKIDSSGKGYAFLVLDDEGEDMFIPPNKLGSALNGDIVSAIQIGTSKGRGEAAVVEILTRSKALIVGTYSLLENFGFVVPDGRFGSDVFVEKQHSMDAAEGDKVVVEIVKYPVGKKPEGKVIEILGRSGGIGVDILSIIRSYELYEDFPKNVLVDAATVPVVVTEQEMATRRDFRGDMVVTIDGADAKDLDDAISVQVLDNGNYELNVHIADVTHYVRNHSLIDQEAFKRGTSVYFADRVLPMLPVSLSNGICSLTGGVDRLVLSCLMEIDIKSGNVVRSKIANGIINSAKRFTYDTVHEVLTAVAELEGASAQQPSETAEKAATIVSENSEFVPLLTAMRTLADALYKRRVARGSIEFELTESKIEMDKAGNVVGISKYPRLISHRIVEEFMLIANETVAKTMFDIGTPFVYRSHLTPPSLKMETLLGFLNAMGISFKGDLENPLPIDFSRMLASLDDKVKGVVNRVALRSMTKASYEPVNNGHFGLAAQFYCHFTSPIRRYPDLMIHRIIKEYLSSGKKGTLKFEEIAKDVSVRSSVRERLAEEAERKVDDLLKAKFMADKIGQEYNGTISGVMERGMFVELDNSVEGMVRLENLPQDTYTVDSALLRIDGSTHSYRIGDSVRIVVDSIKFDKIAFKVAE